MSQNQNSEFDPIKDIKFIMSLFTMMFWFFSKPIEVFIRSGFGERHLKLAWIVTTFVAINIIAIFAGDIPLFGGFGNGIAAPLVIFSYVFLIGGILHNLVIKRRNYNRQFTVISYHRGNSFGIWYRIFKYDGFLNRLIPDFVKRIVDPAFVFIIGTVLLVYNPPLGGFIQFAAVCLFFDEHINYMHLRSRFLDQNDAKIRSEMDRETQQIINQSQTTTASAGVVSASNRKPTRRGIATS